MKSQLRELRILQTYASTVSRTQKEIEKLQREVKELEVSLASSGSTETTDDIQVQLEAIDAKLHVSDIPAIDTVSRF
jgi:DNA repair protein RAD50